MCRNLKRSYLPTSAEHVASILTHALMIPVAFYAGFVLVQKSEQQSALFFLAIVYGICLISLFCVSSAYHLVYFLHHDGEFIEKMCRIDRATIYIFMAATYSPWLFCHPLPEGEGLVWNMRWLIWLIAFMGFTFELTISEKYPILGLCGYLMYGLMPTFILEYNMINSTSVTELKYAGIVYLLGFIFFKAEGVIPFAHAIWHICVIFGASIHYFTVYNNFYSEIASTDELLKNIIRNEL